MGVYLKFFDPKLRYFMERYSIKKLIVKANI